MLNGYVCLRQVFGSFTGISKFTLEILISLPWLGLSLKPDKLKHFSLFIFIHRGFYFSWKKIWKRSAQLYFWSIQCYTLYSFPVHDQWRIGGGGHEGWSFSCRLHQNSCQIIGWRPLGQSWIHHWWWLQRDNFFVIISTDFTEAQTFSLWPSR